MMQTLENVMTLLNYFDTIEPFWQEVLGISEGCLVRMTSPSFHKYPFFSEMFRSILFWKEGCIL